MVRNIFDYCELWFVDFPFEDWQTPADASRHKRVHENVEDNLHLHHLGSAAGDLGLASATAAVDVDSEIRMVEDPR